MNSINLHIDCLSGGPDRLGKTGQVEENFLEDLGHNVDFNRVI